MPRSIQLRVGAYTVDSVDIGFEWVDVFKLGGPWESFTVVAFYRHGIPAVVIDRWLSIDEPFPAVRFASAMTPSLDYPTKPFREMAKMLREQWEYGEASRDIHVFLEDVAGLLVFALQRRGIDVDYYRVWNARASELRELVKKADEPAPSLGNLWYVTMAAELSEIFIAARRVAELYDEIRYRMFERMIAR